MFTSHRTKPNNTTLSKGTRGERLVLFGRVFLFIIILNSGKIKIDHS